MRASDRLPCPSSGLDSFIIPFSYRTLFIAILFAGTACAAAAAGTILFVPINLFDRPYRISCHTNDNNCGNHFSMLLSYRLQILYVHNHQRIAILAAIIERDHNTFLFSIFHLTVKVRFYIHKMSQSRLLPTETGRKKPSSGCCRIPS